MVILIRFSFEHQFCYAPYGLLLNDLRTRQGSEQRFHMYEYLMRYFL